MKHPLLKFVCTVLFASLAFIFSPYLAQDQGWINSRPSFSGEIVSVLALLTLILFYYLLGTKQSRPEKFIQSYMLSITVKMLVGCSLILVIIFMDREGAIANAILFILSYFSLTGIEIFFLLRAKTNA